MYFINLFFSCFTLHATVMQEIRFFYKKSRNFFQSLGQKLEKSAFEL